MKESELRTPVLAHLRADGYRAWAAPDGRDYFDIVAIRGETVGLVELKVAAAAKVFAQALRRRAWTEWVAVALPSERAARRLLASPQAPLAERVGIWVVRDDGTVDELRRAGSMRPDGDDDPFSEARARFRETIRSLADGEIPEGVDWGIFGSPRLPGPRRRSTRDWRLEEFPDAIVSPSGTDLRSARTAPPSDRS